MARINTNIIAAGVEIPITLYIERRNGLRASFGKNAIIIRLSNQLSNDELRTEYIKAKHWVLNTLVKKPVLLEKYRLKEYHNLQLTVMNEHYTIKVKKEVRKTGSIRRKGILLEISIPGTLSKLDENKLIKKLLSRQLGQIYRKQIVDEIHSWNNKLYRQSIKTVRLKYNKSNWGSCSSATNINLSTRLLLVPNAVREYVIIHELSHLIEMNHSRKFWDLIEQACPNYKKHESWLNENGAKIDF